MGGGYGCVNPLPGTAFTSKADNLLDNADEVTTTLSGNKALYAQLGEAVETANRDTDFGRFRELGIIIDKQVPYRAGAADIADTFFNERNDYVGLVAAGCGGVCRHRGAYYNDAARRLGLDTNAIKFKTGKYDDIGEEIGHLTTIFTTNDQVFVADPGRIPDPLSYYLSTKYPKASNFEKYSHTQKQWMPFNPE